MNVWLYPITIFSRKRALPIAGLLALIIALITTFIFASVSQATPGINEKLNFQGRLLNSSGGVVQDGYYNMQFRIYQGGTGTVANNPSGSLSWSEAHTNNNATQGVVVKNGYFSVELGTKTPFGTSVNWNDDTLWLSINVAGSEAACTTFGTGPCEADGEMLPMKRLTSTPYAMNAGKVGGKSANELVQLGQGMQSDSTTNASIGINKLGTGDLINLQAANVDIFNINNSGNITLGSATNQSIGVAKSASGAGKELVVRAGDSADGSNLGGGNLILQGGASSGPSEGSSVIVKSNGSNSTTAFSIQNTAGTSVFSADTATMGITIGGSITQTGTRLSLKHSFSASTATQYPRELDIVGNYAYLLNQGDTGPFTILDITNPGAPSVVSILNDARLKHSRDIRIAGHYAYVVTLEDTLLVLDIANPSAPAIVGSITSAYLNDAHGLEVQGSYVYAAAQNASGGGYFSVFDVSNPSNPTYAASVNHSNIGQAKQVDINGRYAYVTSGKNSGSAGLTIIDIANPKAPVMLGSVLSSQLLGTRDVVVNGKYAYVTSEDSDALTVINVSNPNSPTIAGSVIDSVALDGAFELTLSGNYAYVSSRNANAVTVVDISNPSAPFVVSGAGYTAAGLTPTSSMIKGRYLYVTSGRFSTTQSNLTILDTGGTTFTSTSTNTLDTETLQVHRNADIAGTLNVRNGIYTGEGGITTDGTLKVNGSTTLRSSTNSADAFNVQNAEGATILSANTTDRQVRIGTSSDADNLTLLTVDKAASAPNALGHSAMLGSMYYDTTLGALQCYEAEGWGNCGASPDTFVTLSPEYANAVMNGASTGVITSDLCSDALNINNATNGTEICGTNETFNFYKWTSDQASSQTRSIYITYQLPEHFKSFIADSTSLKARTNSPNATVSYQIYRDTSNGLVSCSAEITASTGTKTAWQNTQADAANDPADCEFEAGESVLFRINLSAHDNANAYVSNLNFAYSTK